MTSPLDCEKLLDDTGWKVLIALQENARVSFAELGRQVGLTPPAVADRVRRIEEAGIITGYRAEISPEKLGLALMAIVRFSAPHETYKRIEPLILACPEVVECHRVTGGDCFTMKVVVTSVAHLENLINRLIPYGALTTSIVLSSLIMRRTIDPATIAWEDRATSSGK